MHNQENIQATSTSDIIGSMNAAADTVDQSNVINIKREPGSTDRDTSPTVLHHMDSYCRGSESEFTVVEMEVNMVHVKGQMTPPGDALTANDEAGVSGEREQVDVGGRDAPHTCFYCLKTFSRKKLLKTHVKHVHGECSYECPECEKNFRCRQYLSKHVLRVHHSEDHECEFCKKIFRSKQSLNRHISYTHLNNTAGTSTQIFICGHCQKTYKNERALKGHIRTLHGTKVHACSKCDKTFKCKMYLTVHFARVHANEDQELHVEEGDTSSEPRPYSCDYCHKKFRSKYSIKEHIVCVHGLRSYRCGKCNKNYKCRQYLWQHNKSVHCKAEHKCKHCKKVFRGEYFLMKHMKHVHGEKLHKCGVCRKKFKWKRNCNRHEKRGKCKRPKAGNAKTVASTRTQRRVGGVVKEEPIDVELELNPFEFQHIDCNYNGEPQ